MFKPTARDALLFQEPACPICFEPFSTEAPDEPEDEDHRPALIYGRPSVCACCFVAQGLGSSTGCNSTLQIDYNLMSSIILLQHVQQALPTLPQQSEIRRLAQSLSSNRLSRHSSLQQDNLREFASGICALDEASSMHSSVSSADILPMVCELNSPQLASNGGEWNGEALQISSSTPHSNRF